MHSELQTSTDNLFRSPSTCSVLFCSLKYREQFINAVSVIRINCKNAQEKPVLMGLLWGCFGLALYRFTRANRTQSI